jgi:hypothetical protein
MRHITVVEPFPDCQLLLQIDIVLVGEELIELVLVGSMGPLDLSVQLRRSWLDVGVLHAQVCDVPVKERLELVAAVRSYHLDPERKLFDDVVYEVDGVGLGVALVDLECPNACGIIDRRVLVAPHRTASFSLQSQELDIHLHVMSRDLLLVAVRVHCPPSNSVGESAHPVSPADPVDRRIGTLDVVVALQAPHDPNRPHVIGPTQVENLLDYIIGGLVGVVVGAAAPATRQALIT